MAVFILLKKWFTLGLRIGGFTNDIIVLVGPKINHFFGFTHSLWMITVEKMLIVNHFDQIFSTEGQKNTAGYGWDGRIPLGYG